MVEVIDRVKFSAYRDAHLHAREHFGAASAAVEGVAAPDGDQIAALLSTLPQIRYN
ncbi:MAG: hypothetical protein Q7T54_04165 [Candidatus Levybacteria bacterium]|nr:hypothetical protein [Candidatus Levybacteria bacterium]